MIAETKLPACIAKRRSQLERELAELDSLVVDANLATEVFFGKAFEIRVCPISGRISVDATLDEYADIVPYLRKLAMLGYRAKKGDEFYESDDKTCRCYSRGGMNIWVHLTGRKCRRVQVGTKTIPVYEIRCGENNGDETDGAERDASGTEPAHIA